MFKSIPGVSTVFSKAGIPIDLTVVRENIEDTYGGIEHMQTNDVAQCRRLITRPGSEQIHRYAFEVALKKKGKRVTCAHKANIMKLTDGLFLETFYKVAKEYPNVKADDVIIDDMAMKLVSRPDLFDVVVLPNLQGDIISDLCAGLVGGLGLAPSANIGHNISIFEAVHGTAPDIAGKDIANPTALLLSGCAMLRHLNLDNQARLIEQGLLRTLDLGFRTRDLATSQDKLVSTSQFTEEIIRNMPNVEEGTDEPKEIKPIKSVPKTTANIMMVTGNRKREKEEVVGFDIFVDSNLGPSDLAEFLIKSANPQSKGLELVMLSNRGTQVWPTGSVFTECVNHYRARFQSKNSVPTKDLLLLASEIQDVAASTGADVRICSLEMLLVIDGKPGFSLAQGQ